MWKPVAEISASWQPIEGTGIENLVLKAKPAGFGVKSQVAGEANGRVFDFTYEIDLDKTWRVLAFSVKSADGRLVSFRSPAKGKWQDGNGNWLPIFDGCVDIDLSFTCFTNSLPVHRTKFARGQSRIFSMVWMPSDTLAPFVDGQRYTCLEPGKRFHYEATDGSFEAEIEFDDHGLVTNYPGLFRRVA